MTRITEKHLEATINRINRITGSPEKPYSTIDGKFTANVGNYHLSGAYGGVCLHRMHNDGGGVSSPLGGGYVPKRELYERMHAFIAGLDHDHAGT